MEAQRPGPIADISVVIPSYQRAALLGRAVKSALAQTLGPMEILVCDDGSTDSSRRTVEAIGDRRVRWFDCPHSGGPAAPRNRGVKEASGTWVAFLDCDDVWRSDKLERQVAALARGFQAVSSNARRLDASGRDQGRLHPTLPSRAGFGELVESNWVVTSAALVRRGLVEDCGGFPEDPALRSVEDYALWLRIAHRTPWAFLSEALVDYRDAPSESVRSDNSGREWILRRRVMGDLLRWSLSRGHSPLLALRAGAAYWRAIGGRA